MNFPRIKNLPNRIVCEDETGLIDIVYFNSREGYLRKIFPLNNWIIISGKVNYFRSKHQITNPDYVTNLEHQSAVVKKYQSIDLLKKLIQKYKSISEQVIKMMPKVDDWLEKSFIQKNNMLEWNEAIFKLHNSKDSRDNESKKVIEGWFLMKFVHIS